MQIPQTYTAPSPTPPMGGGAASAGPADNSARLKNACQQFEGQFFALMLQEMRKTIPKDPLLGDDEHTQEIFTGMMDDQVAQDMAKHGGANDLSDELYRQLAGSAAGAAAVGTRPAGQAAYAATPETALKSR